MFLTGDNKREALIDFMRAPSPEDTSKPAADAEPQWKEEESEVKHLTDKDFDEFIKEEESVMVMFYAPW